MTIRAQTPVVSTPVPASMKTLTTTTASLLPPAAGGSMVNGCAPASAAHPKERHIWFVTGPAGSGKSTLASYLAKVLQLPYVEGDHYHTKANIEKMSRGEPLTDADRWDWLTVLREEALHRLGEHLPETAKVSNGDSATPLSSHPVPGVIVTCSALKRKYRDVIRVAPYYFPDLRVHFIYLRAPEDVLLQRVKNRQGHYMGADMVHSQVSILELPAADETDVVTLDVCRPAEEVRKDALQTVLSVMSDGAPVTGWII